MTAHILGVTDSNVNRYPLTTSSAPKTPLHPRWVAAYDIFFRWAFEYIDHKRKEKHAAVIAALNTAGYRIAHGHGRIIAPVPKADG